MKSIPQNKLLQKPLFWGFILFFAFHFQLSAQQPDPLQTEDWKAQKQWVDSIIRNMSLRQKIGQLFMYAAYSNKGKKHEEYVQNLVEKHEIGGLIFMQGTPYKQAKLTNLYQSKSKIPLLIAFDGEWGLNMRLDSTYRYPWNMTLGAIHDNRLLEKLGRRIGAQHHRMGIHINFAPVVDINTNPNNPIIGNRSYGENKYNVTKKAAAFIKGMQAKGVLACGKHFPGHGDTSKDSHKTLPSVLFDSLRIDSVELYPYKKLFEKNLGSLMTAHLSVPALEKDKSIPTSISKNVVTHLLKEKLGFNGLIITDALNMKGASNYAEPGAIDLAAFLAGNDILLFPEDIPKAITLLEKAYKQGAYTEKRLDYSVRKILKAKYWAGLAHYKPVNTRNLQKNLVQLQDSLLHRELVDQSITLIKKGANFPIVNLQQKIAYIKLGDAPADAFIKMLQKYTDVHVISGKNPKRALEQLKKYDLVIAGYHKSDKHFWDKYQFSEQELHLLHDIAKQNRVILSVFASPYSLLDVADFKPIESIVIAYQNATFAQELTAQKIFGALETTGKLPVRIGDEFKEGLSLYAPKLQRLSYGFPEEVQMNSRMLRRIDSMAHEVITQKMAPGVQVLVARYGKVIYQKSFGYFTYDKKQKVTNTDLYDLASITKICGALPMVMKAYEDKKLTLDQTLGELLPSLKGSNKDTINLRKALSHFAQMQAWIPFYKKTLDSVTHKPLKKYYRTQPDTVFSIKVAEKLYLRKDYQDSIFQQIKDSELRDKKAYKYSGLVFYLLNKFIKKTYGKPLDVLDDSLFYKPLGATRLTYKPLEKFPKNQIVPTENDAYFRYELLQGNVHDMGAAMLGGVNGNAGLFANANSLAKMMQMYLNGGFYGGKRYFNSQTIQTFNHRYYAKDSVRRGLVFDKPQLKPEITATCGCMSEKSFGHSGFTGTYAWVDPETGLLYLFLSNRVYPTMDNHKLVEADIRTKTQQIVVDALVKP